MMFDATPTSPQADPIVGTRLVAITLYAKTKSARVELEYERQSGAISTDAVAISVDDFPSFIASFAQAQPVKKLTQWLVANAKLTGYTAS